MTRTEERLRGELSDVLAQIRRAGGGVVFEEFPGEPEIDSMGDDSSAIRLALIDEANTLAETLERIRRGDVMGLTLTMALTGCEQGPAGAPGAPGAPAQTGTTGAAGAAGATGATGSSR